VWVRNGEHLQSDQEQPGPRSAGSASPPATRTTGSAHHRQRVPPAARTTSNAHHQQRAPPATRTTSNAHHQQRASPATRITSNSPINSESPGSRARLLPRRHGGEVEERETATFRDEKPVKRCEEVAARVGDRGGLHLRGVVAAVPMVQKVWVQVRATSPCNATD
jgi:hypothetical protein